MAQLSNCAIFTFSNLFNFLMHRHLFHDGVEFSQLQALGVVLFVLLGNVAAGAGQTGVFMLRAFQNHLYPVSFLCHCYAL